MLKEFREFAVKGNVIDLAVGVIIGGAFGKIVTSLVNDLIMPLVGIIIGGHDFSSLSIKIGSAQILYGSFIQTVIDFLIISFSIFIFIRYLNKLKRKKVEEEEVVETPDQTEVLLTEIRDLLKNQSQSKDVQ
ncbi:MULTISPECIES: large conductance mechanosensitive channel protein MscL [Bacillus]|jgi:large conductance mechanosensitive channel|uniref:Large-conductance mechanosensitive channel n=1 Tax=Bacillus pumilus TaxID=1408 RepID=A0AAE3WNI7_BACPU|nr:MULTISPECIES: large conductance mechanosensitive channel protein MscL [Bacillus]AOC58519.1 mechanosensitive ion channel protein MscL [Bacillus pumilus]AZV53928.1 large conductance mechanosensitive channel protein MscL [Bacillus pumilus]MBR0586686.1 large conductance mechanosensitive channel protein MscL [Bacillus pumilus DW2J2]MBR0616911.1 large conductance mechanosensitive channel protein MscL [Bacillus pumilus]MBR0620546.1 large conductance mechanosensitive channel protein MscL [Bacillus 